MHASLGTGCRGGMGGGLWRGAASHDAGWSQHGGSHRRAGRRAPGTPSLLPDKLGVPTSVIPYVWLTQFARDPLHEVQAGGPSAGPLGAATKSCV